MCIVVNKYTHKPTDQDVYIGRGSKWGNPFKIGTHGTRQQVIDMYRQNLYDAIERNKVTLKELRELRGKTLVCYCAPLPCHGLVIASAVQWACDGQS